MRLLFHLEVIPFPLELGGGVDLVSHDARDSLWKVVLQLNMFFWLYLIYFLNIFHPLGHLAVAHLIDLFDELIVFLPERHPEAGLKLHSGMEDYHDLRSVGFQGISADTYGMFWIYIVSFGFPNIYMRKD